MNTKMRHWPPIALCCLPGVAIVAIVIGIAAGGSVFGTSFGGPLGLGLIALAVLACPVSMGLMMWMMNKQMGGQQGQSMPGHTSEADRLQALREQRRLLEQEIAEAEKIAALEAQKEVLTRARSAPSDEAAIH